MNPLRTTTSIAALLAIGLAAGPALAQGRGGPPEGKGKPGGTPGEEPTAAHNLSYPVILPEGTTPGGFPSDNAWRFATITDPETQCIGENDSIVPVPEIYPCYYGSQNTEGGLVGDDQVWWLSKRPANFWKAFSLPVGLSDPWDPVAVTAVDVGDLLESSPSLNLRRIRTEVTLLQDATARFADFIPSYPVVFTGDAPAAPCQLPTAANQSVGCFAAFKMSGAVPGTEQSINELQGTDFGTAPDDDAGTVDGTRTLIDPTTVAGKEGFHATVYSPCARLVIQKLTGEPTAWNAVEGYWDGANDPVVEVAAYDGTYSSEVNSGGTLIYGYNWSATQDNEGTGTYRLTYVLDGPPRCDNLNTVFDTTTSVVASEELEEDVAATATTQLMTIGDLGGDVASGTVDDPVYGGLVYIDVPISAKGGGGGGPRGPRN